MSYDHTSNVKDTVLRSQILIWIFGWPLVLDTPLFCISSNQFSIFLCNILHGKPLGIYKTFCLIRIFINGCGCEERCIYDFSVSRTGVWQYKEITIVSDVSHSDLLSSVFVICGMILFFAHQVPLWHVADELFKIVQYSIQLRMWLTPKIGFVAK